MYFLYRYDGSRGLLRVDGIETHSFKHSDNSPRQSVTTSVLISLIQDIPELLSQMFLILRPPFGSILSQVRDVLANGKSF